MSEIIRKKHKIVRVFITESDRCKGQPLYLAIIDLCRENEVKGATVLRGVAGYGLHNVLHLDKVLRLAGDLPLIVEIVDTEEKVLRLIPLIEDLLKGGLITMEDIDVIESSG